MYKKRNFDKFQLCSHLIFVFTAAKIGIFILNMILFAFISIFGAITKIYLTSFDTIFLFTLHFTLDLQLILEFLFLKINVDMY